MRKFFTHLDAVVPMHHPRVLIETAALQGADHAALLEGADVRLDMLGNPDARITYAQFGRLVGNALRATNNPSLGIDVGKATSFAHLGMLGLALMSSATLGDAIAMLLRNYRALVPAFELELLRDGDQAAIVMRESIPLPYLRFALEVFLVAMAQQGRALTGQALPLTELHFCFEEPSYSARYREIVDVPMRYKQPVTQVLFDAKLLDLPITGADPATAQLAERYCEQASPAVLSSEGLLAQVRRILENNRGPAPRLEDVAAALQTSGRSLRRFLQGMGTSYHTLLDAAQQERARTLLRTSDIGLDQISEELGFGSVRAFRRAFKRWTGQSPQAFRATSEH